MSIVDDLLKPETRRNRWGQYLVVPPEGGDPVGYIRATTIAKTLDDGGGLIGWHKRMVALGLAQRPDLLALIATTDDTDKRALDKVCERAAEAGGSTIRRDLGTAFHSAMEASYDDLDAVPQAFLADVLAVHAALKAAGLSVVPGLVEQIVVHDRHRIGGTFDLVLTDGERNYIADLKTGSSVAYGALGFAVQLSIYANADSMYAQGHKKDGSADVRLPMPDLDKTRGIILHARLGEERCDLHWLDLEIGAMALDLAMTVREVRKSKPLSPLLPTPEERLVEKVKATFPNTEEIVGEEWRGWFRARLADISAAGHMEQLRVRWPEGVPTLKSEEHITIEQAEQLEQMTADIEAEFVLAFPSPKPGSGRDLDRWVSRIAVPDIKPNEGPTLGEEAKAAVNELARALDPEARQWMSDMLSAATKAKNPIRISGNGGQRTKRKVAICTALALVASLGPDFAKAVAESASNREVDERGFAHFLGGLSIDEAQRMAVIANAIHDGQIGASIALDGSVQLLDTDVTQVLAP